MATHRGRGFATIEYPTGMNQGGDPSQVWIKVKPDGRVDVFAGTVDIGQGSKTVHTQIAADTIGVPYEWVTMDNSNTDSSPLCTGTFASRGTFIGGNAVAVAAKRVREKLLEIAGLEMEIDPRARGWCPTPSPIRRPASASRTRRSPTPRAWPRSRSTTRPATSS